MTRDPNTYALLHLPLFLLLVPSTDASLSRRTYFPLSSSPPRSFLWSKWSTSSTSLSSSSSSQEKRENRTIPSSIHSFSISIFRGKVGRRRRRRRQKYDDERTKDTHSLFSLIRPSISTTSSSSSSSSTNVTLHLLTKNAPQRLPPLVIHHTPPPPFKLSAPIFDCMD